jgi:hypothetical protein
LVIGHWLVKKIFIEKQANLTTQKPSLCPLRLCGQTILPQGNELCALCASAVEKGCKNSSSGNGSMNL